MSSVLALFGGTVVENKGNIVGTDFLVKMGVLSNRLGINDLDFRIFSPSALDAGNQARRPDQGRLACIVNPHATLRFAVLRASLPKPVGAILLRTEAE